jgi:hypothetical protein
MALRHSAVNNLQVIRNSQITQKVTGRNKIPQFQRAAQLSSVQRTGISCGTAVSDPAASPNLTLVTLKTPRDFNS